MESVLVAHTDILLLFMKVSFDYYYTCHDAFSHPLVNMMPFRMRL